MFRLLLSLTLGFVSYLQAADQPVKTVWDGVYSSAQAGRGMIAYDRHCVRCHGEDLTRSGNVLVGNKFMENWREDSLHNLFSILRDTMPRNRGRSLPDGDYLDIVAFLLSVNTFPAGPEELTLESLERIQVVGKDGPKAVPNFALVTVVGCLSQISGDNWTLKNASEPVRTRIPRESSAAEIANAAVRLPGPNSFGLLDIRNFPEQAVAGHWMEAKGLLIRAPGNDRLNLTGLRMIGESCKQP